ncbi:phage baseplate assembly protein V [Streptomyces sp. NPDC029003]|uniref:phage baseplate assembly protein V n=1 Tax=Streptomyces sp. NPDC029003 TaxID=3155125 RepID=UPI00340DF981
MEEIPRFYGKFRGKVVNNVDPQARGRVQVSVPAVLGDGKLGWAEACVPYAGPGVGFFAVPPVGASVWVEFEQGNAQFPILAGATWGLLEKAPLPGLPQVKVWKTDAVSITLSDLPGVGGLTVEVGAPVSTVPMKIACTAQGIELSIGTSVVKLTPLSVSVNNGALEVV